MCLMLLCNISSMGEICTFVGSYLGNLMYGRTYSQWCSAHTGYCSPVKSQMGGKFYITSKWKILWIERGHIYRDCRKKIREQAGIQVCMTLCTCARTALHEQWMCLGMQRYTHITGNNLIPTSVPLTTMYVHVDYGVIWLISSIIMLGEGWI